MAYWSFREIPILAWPHTAILTELESVYSLCQVHLLVPCRIAWSTTTRSASKRVLFFTANFSNSRVKILPERLYWCCVFLFTELFVPLSHLVSLIVYVRGELLLCQILIYSVNLSFPRMCLAHIYRWSLRWMESILSALKCVTTFLTLRANTFVRVRVCCAATDRTVFINTVRALWYLL